VWVFFTAARQVLQLFFPQTSIARNAHPHGELETSSPLALPRPESFWNLLPPGKFLADLLHLFSHRCPSFFSFQFLSFFAAFSDSCFRSIERFSILDLFSKKNFTPFPFGFVSMSGCIPFLLGDITCEVSAAVLEGGGCVSVVQ